MPTHMDVELGERVIAPGHQGVLERDAPRHEQFERDVVRIETGRECLHPMDPVPHQTHRLDRTSLKTQMNNGRITLDQINIYSSSVFQQNA